MSLVTAAITARWLGPAGRGVLALVMLLPGMLQLFLGFGLNAANVYYTGSRQISLAKLTSNSVGFAFAGTVVGYVVVLALISSSLLTAAVPGVPYRLAVLGMIALPVGLLSSGFSALLQGLRRILTLNVLSVLQAVLVVPFLVIFVVWLRMGVTGAIFASLGAAVLALGASAERLRREGANFWPRWDRAVARSTLGYGMRGYIGLVLQFFNYRLDTFIVNAFLGAAGVGIYGAAVAIAELLWQIPNSVGFVIFPKAAGTSPQEMNRFTPRVVGAVLAISSIGALAVGLGGRLVIRLVFSKAFLASYQPLLALLPGVVLLGGGKVLANDIAGRGYPQYNSVIAGVSVAITVVLDILLIPRVGVLGAAIASTASYATTFLVTSSCYLLVSRRGSA